MDGFKNMRSYDGAKVYWGDEGYGFVSRSNLGAPAGERPHGDNLGLWLRVDGRPEFFLYEDGYCSDAAEPTSWVYRSLGGRQLEVTNH